MNQLYIKNWSGGPFKIPFKLGTPYDAMSKVKGVIASGKSVLIPVDIVPYIDMERIQYHKTKREIKVSEKKVRMPRVGVKPVHTEVVKVQKPKPTKVEKVKIEKVKTKGDN